MEILLKFLMVVSWAFGGLSFLEMFLMWNEDTIFAKYFWLTLLFASYLLVYYKVIE